MTIVSLMIFGAMGLLGIGIVYAFYWAATNGQLSQLDVASRTIFDADERIGSPTDRFPGGAWSDEDSQINKRKDK